MDTGKGGDRTARRWKGTAVLNWNAASLRYLSLADKSSPRRLA